MNIYANLQRFAAENRIALIDAKSTMSYAELDLRSSSIAFFLSNNFPGKEPVIVWGDKEHDMLVFIIAALKAGKAYTAVPSYYPQERADNITRISQACVVLCAGSGIPPITVNGVKVILQPQLNSIAQQYLGKREPENCHLQSFDLCTVFFTSGSTGEPKGVAITYSNIEALANWWCPIIKPLLPQSGGRVLNNVSYAFSSSLDNVFNMCLYSGMTLYAVNRELETDYPKLFEFILKTDPHYYNCTPTFIDICLQDPRFCAEYLPGFSVAGIGGEKFPRRIAAALVKRFPAAAIFNAYGATETTIGPMCIQLTPEIIARDEIMPIGGVAPDTAIYLVDENGKEVPDGTAGEMLVVNDMISAGYLNTTEQSAKNYFTAADGRRGFRTRDLVYRAHDLYYYVGRTDNLVKVGGYRIELDDVDQAISKIDIVRASAVVPVVRKQRIVMLCAYIVLKEPAAKKLAAVIHIKTALTKTLQPYMLPQKIIILDDLPLNNSGKIDRLKLKEMAALPINQKEGC